MQEEYKTTDLSKKTKQRVERETFEPFETAV